MNKNEIRDIGTLEGKVLAFGGVYSNLPALEQLVSMAEAAGIAPPNIICTGDIVGYCAQPEECVQLIRGWGIQVIAGNVEMQLREGLADCGCNFTEGSRCDTLSQQWYPFAQKSLTTESLAWMDALPLQLRFRFAGLQGAVVHGSAFAPAEFIFKSSPWEEKSRNFQETGAELILAGHCGLPFADGREGKKWLNPGVIGLPANDGTSRVWCLLLEDSTQGLRFRHLPFHYDHDTAYTLMKSQGLPSAYADTLLSGLWDNCDILPEEETRQQGKRLFPACQAQ